jgi:hypothetical protein
MGCCAAASSDCRSTVLLLRLQGAMLLLLVSVVTMPGGHTTELSVPPHLFLDGTHFHDSRRPRILVVIEFLVMLDYLSYFFSKLSYSLSVHFLLSLLSSNYFIIICLNIKGN